jgi:hypothetical protein
MLVEAVIDEVFDRAIRLEEVKHGLAARIEGKARPCEPVRATTLGPRFKSV